MILTINRGQQTAKDEIGNIFAIEGFEITRQSANSYREPTKVFYDTSTSFFKACASAGVKKNAVVVNNGNIILVG
jgi:hypothetical protein